MCWVTGCVCVLMAANQEVLVWLKRLQEDVGSEVTNEKLKDFIWSTLKSGQVLVAMVSSRGGVLRLVFCRLSLDMAMQCCARLTHAIPASENLLRNIFPMTLFSVW